MSLTRYPTYKDSGVEWLGDVPEHWQTTPLRGLACEERHAFIDGDWIEAPFITDEGIRLIQTGNIGVGYYKEQGFRYISFETFELLRCSEISPGDVLICRLAEPVGRACIAPDLDSRMITSVDVCILKPRTTVDPRFVVYTLSSAQYLGFMEGQCRGGTRDRVSRSFLGRVRVPVPAVSEQAKIADFLDIETAKIDALVAEQRTLIELLKEKRQAVISHAVTKGLNPDVLMMPSGIEWIGDVPAHWEKCRLRHLFRQVKRQDHADFPVLSVYREFGVILKDSRSDNLNKTPEDLRSYQLVRQNDLVVNKMKAWQGSLGISDLVGITSPDYVVFTPLHQEHSAFLHLLMRSQRMVTVYRGISNGIRLAQWRLEPDRFLDLPLFLPPASEQRLIADFVAHQVARFETLAAEAQALIELLKERRVALISAAVTGQIDVRGFTNPEAE